LRDIDDVGQRFGICFNLVYSDDAGYVDTAVADENTDSWRLAGEIDFIGYGDALG
jgi:hypothetical protein